MTDIVDLLKVTSPDDYEFSCELMSKAADEIERLRSENQKLNHHIDLLQTRLYLNKIPHRVEGIDDVPNSQDI